LLFWEDLAALKRAMSFFLKMLCCCCAAVYMLLLVAVVVEVELLLLGPGTGVAAGDIGPGVLGHGVAGEEMLKGDPKSSKK